MESPLGAFARGRAEQRHLEGVGGCSMDPAGFFLHFLSKCTEKGYFSIENHRKRGKTGPGVTDLGRNQGQVRFERLHCSDEVVEGIARMEGSVWKQPLGSVEDSHGLVVSVLCCFSLFLEYMVAPFDYSGIQMSR